MTSRDVTLRYKVFLHINFSKNCQGIVYVSPDFSCFFLLDNEVEAGITNKPQLSKKSKMTFSLYSCHGQYLVYSAKSSIMEECIIVIQVLVYKHMFSFFEQCIIVFQAPVQFQKNKDVSNTILHQPICLAVVHMFFVHFHSFHLSFI